MKPVKHSIAYVIYNANRSRVLAVQASLAGPAPG